MHNIAILSALVDMGLKRVVVMTIECWTQPKHAVSVVVSQLCLCDVDFHDTLGFLESTIQLSLQGCPFWGGPRGTRHHVCIFRLSMVGCRFLGFEESRTVNEQIKVYCTSLECEYFYY